MVGVVKLFLVVAFLLIAAQCDAISVSSPRSRRSSKWDDFMEGLRQKRQAGPCTATYKPNPCPIADVTEFDSLERRDSGLLAGVQCQGTCGSCWAFAAAHMYTDFTSISAEQKKDLVSPQYVTECADSPTGNGCCGGFGTDAAKHFVNTGAVSDQCLPYTLQNYVTSAANKIANPLICSDMCSVNGLAFNPASLKAPMGLFRYATSLPDDTIVDLLALGTVIWAGMLVDENFFSYVCGVHTRQPGAPVCGRHAVEIVDNGTTDNGCEFWVVKNSWGTDWGESGYFRIRKGELSIQNLLLVFPLPENSPITPGAEVTDSTTVDLSSQTGAPEVVDNPSQDPSILAAVAFGLEEIANLSVICPNSTNVTLKLDTVVNGTKQVIKGLMICVTVRVFVCGCDNDTYDYVVVIKMWIIKHLGGSFEFSLIDYEYSDDGAGGSSPPTIATTEGGGINSACLLLLLLMAIAALVLSNAM